MNLQTVLDPDKDQSFEESEDIPERFYWKKICRRQQSMQIFKITSKEFTLSCSLKTYLSLNI